MSNLKIQNAVACCLARARESLHRREAATRFIAKLANKPSWTEQEIAAVREYVSGSLQSAKPR